MSGGSWEYLYLKDAVELLDRMSDLRKMKERLRQEGFTKAASHVVSLITQLEYLQDSILVINQGLVDGGLGCVFKAVEWYDSGDTTHDGMKERIGQYEDAWCSNRRTK